MKTTLSKKPIVSLRVGNWLIKKMKRAAKRKTGKSAGRFMKNLTPQKTLTIHAGKDVSSVCVDATVAVGAFFGRFFLLMTFPFVRLFQSLTKL